MITHGTPPDSKGLIFSLFFQAGISSRGIATCEVVIYNSSSDSIFAVASITLTVRFPRAILVNFSFGSWFGPGLIFTFSLQDLLVQRGNFIPEPVVRYY